MLALVFSVSFLTKGSLIDAVPWPSPVSLALPLGSYALAVGPLGNSVSAIILPIWWYIERDSACACPLRLALPNRASGDLWIVVDASGWDWASPFSPLALALAVTLAPIRPACDIFSCEGFFPKAFPTLSAVFSTSDPVVSPSVRPRASAIKAPIVWYSVQSSTPAAWRSFLRSATPFFPAALIPSR